MLKQNSEGGEEQHRFQALLVHCRQSTLGCCVLRMLGQRIKCAEHRFKVASLDVLTSEIRNETSRLGHRIEGRVGEETVYGPRYEKPPSAVERRPLDGSFRHGGVEVTRKRVGGLVIMVVGVEET